MNIFTLALLLAQVFVPTPEAIATAQPTSISESAALDTVAANGVARARSFDGTLGVVIMDLATGTQASRNADRVLPLQSVQKLPIAVLLYRAIEKGAITDTPALDAQVDAMIERSDNGAAKAVLESLGGAPTANGMLATLGYGGITLDPDDRGSGTAHDIARLLQAINDGSLLTPSSQKRLLEQLANASTFPGRLRAGFPPKTRVMHKTGTSATVDGITDATNDVGIISLGKRTMIVVALLQGSRGDDRLRDGIIAGIARGAYSATLQFPVY